ncbi:hypothetical protein ACWTU6_03100 [Mesorhizobium sp. BHbsci]
MRWTFRRPDIVGFRLSARSSRQFRTSSLPWARVFATLFTTNVLNTWLPTNRIAEKAAKVFQRRGLDRFDQNLPVLNDVPPTVAAETAALAVA